MTPDELLQGLLHGTAPVQRRAMAKAITLLESTRVDHRVLADELLTAMLPHTGRSFRLGISGVPGVGKSTFIEALGLYLIGQGHRVAVLAVDPSSTVSGGSILGDKTRMEHLSVHAQVLHAGFVAEDRATRHSRRGVDREHRHAVALPDQVQAQRLYESAFAHARHATDAQAERTAGVRQHGCEQLVGQDAVVHTRRFEQGDGLGHGTALHRCGAVQQALQQFVRCHAGSRSALAKLSPQPS